MNETNKPVFRTGRTLGTYISLEDYDLIGEAAKELGLTISEWAREVLVEAAKKQKKVLGEVL